MAGKAMALTRNPHAMRIIEQLQETGSQLAAAALPTLARTARKTGHGVAQLAEATSKDIAHRLADADPRALTRLGRRRGAFALGRGVVRFAARRPVLLVLGGVAVAGLAIAVGRRMREARMEGEGQESEGLNGVGEGSYEGAQDYRKRTKRFLKDKGDTIGQRAGEAKDALDGSEHASLERAEQEGLSHSRA